MNKILPHVFGSLLVFKFKKVPRFPGIQVVELLGLIFVICTKESSLNSSFFFPNNNFMEAERKNYT